jgi:hypothetical protein
MSWSFPVSFCGPVTATKKAAKSKVPREDAGNFDLAALPKRDPSLDPMSAFEKLS